MKINRAVLDNGLRVVHCGNPGSQMVYTNVIYAVGSKNEEYEYTGIAHLFEHLMFEGTKNIPSFDEPLERAGGENNAYTNNDVTNYYISLPKQNAELAFWLESDRMCNLSLSAGKVDIQRNVVIEEFKQGNLNCPYGDVSMLLRALAYKKHSYRWSTIGRKVEHIANVPLKVLRDFYRRYYSPGNAVLVVVGDIPFSQVMEWSRKWFGPIAPRACKHPLLPQEPRQERMRRKTVYRPVPENALYMAFHMGGRDDAAYYACDLISDILSNGYSGRLQQRLVKEKKLFTKIDAFISGSEHPGLFWIYSRVASGVAMEDAEAALWAELDELKRNQPPADEMEKVKNRFESDFYFKNMSGENLANNLAIAELRGNVSLHGEEVSLYRSVTAADVCRTARDLFRRGNASVLYYMKENGAEK